MRNSNKHLLRMAPPVSPEVLIAANKVVSKYRKKGWDPIHSLAMGLSKKYSPDEITAAYFRLKALAEAIRNAPKNAWIISPSKKKYTLVNEVMYHAAASTPLHVNDEGNLAFDAKELLQAALLDSDHDGSA